MLHGWPVDEPRDWLDWVNRPQTDAEVEEIRTRVRNGRPYGSKQWERRLAPQLGLAAEPRPRGRPFKER